MEQQITKAMFGIGHTEILIILIIFIILFGAKRIPELGKGLADGIKSFRKGIKEDTSTETEKETEKKS